METPLSPIPSSAGSYVPAQAHAALTWFSTQPVHWTNDARQHIASLPAEVAIWRQAEAGSGRVSWLDMHAPPVNAPPVVDAGMILNDPFPAAWALNPFTAARHLDSAAIRNSPEPPRAFDL